MQSINTHPSIKDQQTVSKLLCKYRPRHAVRRLRSITLLAYLLMVPIAYLGIRHYNALYHELNTLFLQDYDSYIGALLSHLNRLVIYCLALNIVLSLYNAVWQQQQFRLFIQPPLNPNGYLFTITERGLQCQDDECDALFYWSGIKKLAYDSGYLLIFTTESRALYIAERDFPSPAAAQDYYRAIQAHCPHLAPPASKPSNK